MRLSKEEFKQKIQKELDTRHLADHPLVRAVAEGQLSRDQLARFAGHWYHAIKEAPRFLVSSDRLLKSSVHASISSARTATDPGHPEHVEG